MSESGYFAVIPGWLLSAADISDGAKLFYGEVSRRCNERGYCWASNETLAKELHCGERTISRYVAELETVEAIVTEDVGVSDRKRRHERRIRLAEAPRFNVAKNGELNVAKNGEDYKENNKSKNNTPLYPPKGEGAGSGCCQNGNNHPDRFEKFWTFYRDTVCASDHGRAGGKAAARAAWDKLKPDKAQVDRLAAYLEAQTKTEYWQRGIGIPYAATMLNKIRKGEITLELEAQSQEQPRGKRWLGTRIIDGEEVDVFG